MKRRAARVKTSTSVTAIRPEVLVIGAGAVGAACASALARAGHRVRVLSHPARGTTSISGGSLLLQSKQPGPALELARRSLALLHELAAGQEQELGYRQTGSLVLATSPLEAEALRSRFEALGTLGVPLKWMDGGGARRMEPALGADVIAATYCPEDAQIDPPALGGAWLQDALAHGASLTSGAAVESFILSRGAVVGVVTTGGAEYPAAGVVLAAGPWSGEVARMAGASVEIRPRRGILLRGHSEAMLATRPLLGAEYLPAKFSDTECAVAFSFQQHPDGRCVLGGTREFAGFSRDIPPALPEQVIECAASYLPAVRQMEWTADVGFRPWTPDGQPRIGPCGVAGLYLASGHEGDGITLAAATAELIAQAVRV